MMTVNMLDAKTRLSQLVDAVEKGQETEIIIARNGRPAARLVALAAAPQPRRLGHLADQYPDMSLEDFNADDDEIAKMFGIAPKP